MCRFQKYELPLGRKALKFVQSADKLITFLPTDLCNSLVPTHITTFGNSVNLLLYPNPQLLQQFASRNSWRITRNNQNYFPMRKTLTQYGFIPGYYHDSNLCLYRFPGTKRTLQLIMSFGSVVCVCVCRIRSVYSQDFRFARLLKLSKYDALC